MISISICKKRTNCPLFYRYISQYKHKVLYFHAAGWRKNKSKKYYSELASSQKVYNMA